MPDKEGGKVLNDPYFWFLLVSLVGLLGFVSIISLNTGLNHDELEHVHSAWYVANGFLPYGDFFQNHNPLIWYICAPLLGFLGETAASILAMRVICLFFMLGSLAVSLLITRRLTSSLPAGIVSLLLLLTSSFFLASAYQIRPDVPQVFFGLWGVYFLLLFIEKSSGARAVLSGMSLALSFLFLQKAVFLIGAAGLVFVFFNFRDRLPFRYLLLFGVSFAAPILAFLAVLFFNGLIEDYYITNYLVNLNRIRTFSPLRTISRFADRDYLFLIFALFSLPVLLLARGSDRKTGSLAFITLLMVFSIRFHDRPHSQNFLPMLPLLAIGLSVFLHRFFERFKTPAPAKILIMLLLIGIPFRNVLPKLHSSNRPRLEAIMHVVENTGPNDPVYDGNIKFNVYRPDLHYFWYSVNRGKLLDSYNRVTGNRFGKYDIYDLIFTRKPKFISLFDIDREDPRFEKLMRMYSSTPYLDIHRLNKEK